jgi:hypothetical protein
MKFYTNVGVHTGNKASKIFHKEFEGIEGCGV